MPQDKQVAIVTGGTRGIGRAICLRLASEGVAVCVNYAAHPDAANQVASEIVRAGGHATVAQADVADAVGRMVARTEAELGPTTISSPCPARPNRRRGSRDRSGSRRHRGPSGISSNINGKPGQRREMPGRIRAMLGGRPLSHGGCPPWRRKA
jgi:NAD(P)-dependent dehydrogenase (short-subunit alcohol dehydrogenase family)